MLFFSSSSAGRVTWILLPVLCLCLFAAGAAAWFALYACTPVSSDRSSVVVEIPAGSSFDKTAHILAQKGLIRGDIRFKVLALMTGDSRKIQAGEFRLDVGQTPVDLLKQLTHAKTLQYRITIPEGLNVCEIAHLFAEKGWGDEQSFLALAKDKNFTAELGFAPAVSLEGYLYPDTYYLTHIPKLSERDILTLMTRRFNIVWKKISDGQADIAKTVTLASIVEKETGNAAERPMIAAVFQNRLRTGMRLQSDPTVIYGLPNFNGNITRADLATPTPYNTYQISGLPPGPICSPGAEAIRAVLHPADVRYLYFVSKNDGTHYFSESLSEHNRAVNRYQRHKK